MNSDQIDIFKRLLEGNLVRADDKDFYKVHQIVEENAKLLMEFNSESKIDKRTIIFKKNWKNFVKDLRINPPFQIDFGRHTFCGFRYE
ncbi:LbetaH domain-containing protein [Pediococcus claussenii]|uniref:Uncharacterized protein n=1 Tax=Pediococcus claussenii (strain ATCC BAA-344 / DSM 14800 / JCM 18046 / KCTC 3811 / LMG 21948 / P06) TaxID=701521 RepID=G8PAW0_PEDCP|nr:hypothetical protein [Pediococcus claussenii]AEV95828.1 hypothetical protein PECL_1610 [Pediococcus claussenii ATCC BAA-344]ANZ69325.1 hypothetical protein AYR57_02960 [Pediococcus claussenii]ANZ71145.1 hypothetical protein AYR58_02975 [Pediococcus claussenii]KRN20434.1 hypothetical protein IV79_GL000489 [Pediococcus claussenii]